MKTKILLLLFLPVICFSQNKNTTAPSKPLATACPDFNDKNKPSNKGEYYKSLRSMKKVKKNETVIINTPQTKTKKTPEPQPQLEKKVEKEAPLEKIETKEKENTKKKTKHLPRRNTTKTKKHSASACPNF
jgi:outer membrane biosynthesis protein TonB